MRKLHPNKIFTQYRGKMTPFSPIDCRKYTVTHSDTTGNLFVFISEEYAEDQIKAIRDEVRIAWEMSEGIPVLLGSVLVDSKIHVGNSEKRNAIFYKELPTALKAIYSADRFLFEENPSLKEAEVLVHFISESSFYDKSYNFGKISDYRMEES